MAFASDEIGSEDERVRVDLGDKTTLILEAYEVTAGVFTQPSAFSLQLGWGDNVRDLLARTPPNTKFKLYVGNALQQSGRTDGYRVPGNGGAPVVHIRGRDGMAPLHDGYVPAETHFVGKTYRELVEAAMRAVKHEGSLILTDAEPRNVRTGVKVKTTGEPKSAEDIAMDRGAKGAVSNVVKASMGETWLTFLGRELGHAGLFLWASPYGDLVLTRPSTTQEALYRIYRTRDRRGQNQANIIDWNFQNETTGRFSEAGVYSRAGGKKYGRSRVKGQFDDEEMQALGYERILVLNDSTVPDARSAELLARRKLAETRRNGFQLQYTVAGHKTPTLFGGRAVWSPNTIVKVHDEDLGITDNFWIERVTFSGPPTRTTLVLIRTTDLFFEDDEA